MGSSIAKEKDVITSFILVPGIRKVFLSKNNSVCQMKWVIPNGFVINWINVILTEIVLTNAWDVIVTGKYRNGWIS